MILAAVSATASQISRNPMVRVVTISQAELRHGNDEDLLEDTMSRLDQAAVFHPDIACLPEVFPRKAAEPVPGPVTTRLARWAKEHSSYVLFGMKTARNGAIYNSAILIDRKGQIIGQYNKMHPTEGELKRERLRVEPTRRYLKPTSASLGCRSVSTSTGTKTGSV